MRALQTCVLAATCCLSVQAQDDWVEVKNPFPIAIRNAAVWDSVRSKVVLVVRTDNYSHQRIVEWDGADWIERPTPPSSSPPFRQSFEIAYDEARGETVMFGGYSNPNGFFGDTWVWDGHNWEQRSPSTAPSARSSVGIGYDPVRERVVLFGGGTSGVHLNDTWEWDGSNWTQMTPATVPPSRYGGEIAWDPNTQRLIMFGGQQSAAVEFDDTWAWDGSDWTLLSPANRPPAGNSLRMTTDWARSLVVAVAGDGYDNDVYTWDGTDWTLVPTTLQPNSPWNSILAFDGNSGGVISAFGNRLSITGHYYTLLFDGTDWATVFRHPLPALRRMVTDTIRNRIVMFSSATEEPTEIWEWDGRDWHAFDPTPAPHSSLRHPKLAFDRGRGVTVLFGGWLGGSAYRDETWEWNGTNWTQAMPALSPSPRVPTAMGYDPIRDQVVLFGGLVGPAQFVNDTWTWDGSNWTQLTPATSPPNMQLGDMVWDNARQRLVMVATDQQYVSQTWEWDGSDWVQANTTNHPAYSNRNGLAYDFDRNLVVRYATNQFWTYDGTDWTLEQNFGGGDLSDLAWDPANDRVIASHYYTGNLWIYGPPVPASVESVGAGCTGTQGVPKLSSYGNPSSITGSFALELIDGRPTSSTVLQLGIGGTSSALPFGGCTLHAATPAHFVIPMGASNDRGYASLPLSIPQNTSLLGSSFMAQALVLDPAGAGAGLIAGSNGVRVTVGF